MPLRCYYVLLVATRGTCCNLLVLLDTRYMLLPAATCCKNSGAPGVRCHRTAVRGYARQPTQPQRCAGVTGSPEGGAGLRVARMMCAATVCFRLGSCQHVVAQCHSPARLPCSTALLMEDTLPVLARKEAWRIMQGTCLSHTTGNQSNTIGACMFLSFIKQL